MLQHVPRRGNMIKDKRHRICYFISEATRIPLPGTYIIDTYVPSCVYPHHKSKRARSIQLIRPLVIRFSLMLGHTL